MAHITKLKSPLGKQTTVNMNKFIFSLLVLISYSTLGKSQNTGASIDDINETRIMFDMDDMTDAEEAVIENATGIEEIYRTTIGNISIYKITNYPVEGFDLDSIPFSFDNIIEINTGLRPGTGTGEAGTETDNYDFKSILTAPDNSGYAQNTNPLVCPNYKYSLRPDRKRIRVAVFDSGINTHFETEGYNPNVFYNKTMIGDFTDDNEAEDDNNHGTHIAHIIQNVSGSTQGNFVEYMDYKVINAEGNGFMADLIMAADQAVIEHHANILNISLSSVQGSRNYLMNKFFNAMLEHNVLIVTSAGNDDEEINASNNLGMYGTPANFLNVGSINCLNTISSFSNTGTMTNIYISGEDINSYNRFGDPYFYSGTSQAAGILSGMAAALATHQDQFDAAELKCALLGSIDEQSAGQNTPTVDIDVAYTNIDSPCTYQGGNGFGEANSNQNTNINIQEIYPNPAFDNITITTNKGSYSVTMNDLLGKTLLNRQIEAYSKNHTEKINLPISLQRGFHYVTIVNNDTNEVTTKKVMIMN